MDEKKMFGQFGLKFCLIQDFSEMIGIKFRFILKVSESVGVSFLTFRFSICYNRDTQKIGNLQKLYWRESREEVFRQMIQFFARVVELREGKIAFASESVKYDGKVTTDSPSREFLEVTNRIAVTSRDFRIGTEVAPKA